MPLLPLGGPRGGGLSPQPQPTNCRLVSRHPPTPVRDESAGLHTDATEVDAAARDLQELQRQPLPHYQVPVQACLQRVCWPACSPPLPESSATDAVQPRGPRTQPEPYTHAAQLRPLPTPPSKPTVTPCSNERGMPRQPHSLYLARYSRRQSRQHSLTPSNHAWSLLKIIIINTYTASRLAVYGALLQPQDRSAPTAQSGAHPSRPGRLGSRTEGPPR